MSAAPERNDGWSGVGVGLAITSTMIGGIAALGGLGYLADRLLGIEHVFLPIGFVLGAAAAIYIIWLRYGKGEGDGT